MEPWAVHINSEQSFELNKAIHCRQLKFEFFYEDELPRHLDPDSGMLTPGFKDFLTGWYGVQETLKLLHWKKFFVIWLQKTSAESASFSSSMKY
jgi:hypothetical protein